MIDTFALGVTHALMMLAAVLMLRRPDLDSETPDGAPARSGTRGPRSGRSGMRSGRPRA